MAFKLSSLPIRTAAIVCLWGASACTKLDQVAEEPNYIAEAKAGVAPPASSLSKVYEQLNQLVGQANWYALQEHSTDELIGPTRGTDWDDFGTWRRLHLHTWDATHNQVNDTWNGLNGALFQTTLLAESTSANAQTKAEARFLRAFFSYLIVDTYGQLQVRPATAAIQEIPSVLSRSAATDYLITELEAVIPQLPAFTRANRSMATREAAQFLLAKVLLNKAVFKQDPTKPAGPFTFAAADMNRVITLVDQITTNPALALSTNYWDNFTWENGTKSTENLFVRKNSEGINVVWASAMGNHYSMPPDGWNGFTTLSDFYNSFSNNDVRKSASIPQHTPLAGRPAGFLIGQQQGPRDKRIGNPLVNLQTRNGSPLVFTPDVSLFFNTEEKGIRTNKYPLNPATMNDGGWSSENEYVFFRLSDAMLMKAEAILRGGTGVPTPAIIVNTIRTLRGATALGTVDLNAVLAERGRELYLEGWRRNDMIRFGVFNNPIQERPQKTQEYKVVFPIPNIALSSNPNLKQNFGY